jgi:hypothetical protein
MITADLRQQQGRGTPLSREKERSCAASKPFGESLSQFTVPLGPDLALHLRLVGFVKTTEAKGIGLAALRLGFGS